MHVAGTIRTPELKKIAITDRLFRHYADMVAEKMLPVQWDILNGRGDACSCYCIDNFKIAAGLISGEHRGVVFGDTDAYKWLEAVAFCANNGHTKYLPMADELIGWIAQAQQPDGYLNTYFTVVRPDLRWKNLTEGHELYSAGHLLEAAVAYYNATGRDQLLQVAQKFADLICETFGTDAGQIPGYPGHQEIELGLIKLWRVTGKEAYLRKAKYFLDQRGSEPNYLVQEMTGPEHVPIFPELQDYDPSYSQSHMPPAEQTTAEGHAVRAMYQFSAMADISLALGDEKLKKACMTVWENIVGKRMYITGGIGSSGLLERFTVDYDLPNDRMYCESCASIGLMMFGQRMAAMTRKAKFYDTVERALYNTVIGGVSARGDRYFYVNPLEVWPDNCMEHSSLHYVKPVRQKWFEVACCPANIARTLASLGQYIYAVDDKSLYINLLIGSRIQTVIRQTQLDVEVTANFMSGGDVTIKAVTDGDNPVLIRVRIPYWMKEAAVSLNGKPIFPAVDDGYAVLALNHPGEHIFQISGKVPARYICANLNVRANVGRVAMQKGPFVYCLEQIDNGPNLAALQVDVKQPPVEAAPVEALPGQIPTLETSGRRVTATGVDREILYSDADIQAEPCTIRAIPYCLWENREPGELRVWVDAVF